jgi:hypothetical protein
MVFIGHIKPALSISHLNPYRCKPRGASCVSYPSPFLSLKNNSEKASLHLVRCMPLLAINSSSPSDLDAHGDHLGVLLHQKNPLVKGYLQDMAVHQVVVVGRHASGVRRSGTSRTLIFCSIPFTSVILSSSPTSRTWFRAILMLLPCRLLAAVSHCRQGKPLWTAPTGRGDS